ncbi:hypothetical protein CDD83_9386 [Cordyceps sp. RAO-2017]|nr:hypothetical protein CDD83_9386 [Cordyceps sp. RAO-2017]
MAPKKKEQQKMSLGDFLTDSGFGGGSWADEVEETYVTGTQPLPPSDRPRPSGMSSWQDRSYPSRPSFPTSIPDKPPYTAHLGNLSYDATVETVSEFFEGCDVASVRIIEDREMQRPKGFGYVEFTNVDGLKKALDLDGQSFQGRMIKIKVADPPRGGDGRMESARDLTDWTRKGPLPDLPTRSGRQPSDFGDRRPRDPAVESRPARELTWERRGPLSPLPQQEFAPRSRDGSRPRPAPEGLGERSESFRGNRQAPPAAWGEPRQEAARPPRWGASGEQQPQPERASSSAAEKDLQWRDRMRPDAAVKSTSPSRDGSEAPPSPSMSSAAPAAAMRPRLNLQKRTVSEAADAVTTPVSGTDSKASPFGAARPIDTATREKEIEEKRQQAIREKREADEKAKEERRLAKQAATAKAEADAEAEAEAAKAAEEKAAAQAEAEAEAKGEAEAEEKQNGAAPAGEQKGSVRNREAREPSKDSAANPNG